MRDEKCKKHFCLLVFHFKEPTKKDRMSMDWFQGASLVNTSRLSENTMSHFYLSFLGNWEIAVVIY